MNGDRISGSLLLLLGLAVIGAAWEFYVPYQYEPLGPKAMPYLVGGMLTLCGLRLLATSMSTSAAETISDPTSAVGQPMSAPPTTLWWRQWLLCILLLGYGLSYEPLGFVISSLILSSSLAWMCGARFAWSLGVALGVTLVGHLVLVQGLGLQLSPGLLERWV